MALGFTVPSQYGGPFNVIPDKGFNRSVATNTIKISFGDGYEQRVSKGINNSKQNYSLTISNRPRVEADNIADYLTSLKGVSAFNLNIPDFGEQGETDNEKTIRVVCDGFTQTYLQNEHYTITMQVRRVYEA